MVFTSLKKGALAIEDIPSKGRQDDIVWFVKIYNTKLHMDLNILSDCLVVHFCQNIAQNQRHHSFAQLCCRK